MRGGIGAEGEVVFLGFISQCVQDDARLDPGESPLRIDLKDLVHVLGEVQHHRDIAALSGKTRAGPAGQDRGAVFLARSHSRDHILVIAWNDQTDGNLPVIRTVRAYKARLPRSNRTSPFTTRFNSLSSSAARENESTGFRAN